MTTDPCTCLPSTYWYPAEPDESCVVHGGVTFDDIDSADFGWEDER